MSNNRILPMDGLRGVAVIGVFFVHYNSQINQTLGLPLPYIGLLLQKLGHYGVDLFFIISGYLIYSILINKSIPFYYYITRRINRIYPTFLFVFVLYLIIAFTANTSRGLPSDWYELSKIILANILFLPGVFSIQPIVIVAWSLSYEAAFYLTLPLIIRILYMRNWQAWIRCGLIALAVLLMLTLDWRHSRMGFFACGMLLVEAKPWLNIRLDIHALITLPFCALAILFANSDIAFIIFFVFGFFLCASAFYGCGFVSNTLSYPPLCQLGTISYSYYLIHGLIMDVFFHALRPLSPWLASHGTTGWWALLPITFMATIVGSAVLFFLVEKPFSIRKLQRQVSVESKPLFTSSYSS